jgi:hypothetical protein
MDNGLTDIKSRVRVMVKEFVTRWFHSALHMDSVLALDFGHDLHDIQQVPKFNSVCNFV